jgi:hypothetical protein
MSDQLVPGYTKEDRRQLERLGIEVQRIHQALAAMQLQIRELVTVEEARRLSQDEAQRLRALQWESQGFQLELQRLRDDFTAIRERRGARPG